LNGAAQRFRAMGVPPMPEHGRGGGGHVPGHGFGTVYALKPKIVLEPVPLLELIRK
jgi:hypothetical protein